jgi:hypothetical protein
MIACVFVALAGCGGGPEEEITGQQAGLASDQAECQSYARSSCAQIATCYGMSFDEEFKCIGVGLDGLDRMQRACGYAPAEMRARCGHGQQLFRSMTCRDVFDLAAANASGQVPNC